MYVPGKELHIADHVSRSYLKGEPSDEFLEYKEEIPSINMSSEREIQFQEEAAKDELSNNIILAYTMGWPMDKKKLPDNLKQYWKFRNNLESSENYRNLFCR